MRPMRQSAGLPLSGVMSPGQLPTAGINARDAAIRMQPDDALDLVNFLSDAYGITMRYGYQEYARDLPGSLAVPTLMSYYPGSAGQSFAPSSSNTSVTQQTIIPRARAADVTLNGQLFACTNGRIFDITAGGAGPWTAQPGVTATSDYWTWLNYQNAAGNFLVATNDDGKYAVYGEAGFSNGFSNGFATQATGWSTITSGPEAGQVGGINPDLFAFVASWKRRLWFVEKNSTRAWYLPVEQLTGQATMFDFGPFFRHGGLLVGIYNWTQDGGGGIDSFLVALSDQGDVVIFKGYDPDSADTDPAAFQLHGVWYVGALPVGRRQVNQFGGDLHILSIYGITALSKLLAQANIAANMVEDVSSRIDPYIAQLMATSHGVEGWYTSFLPNEQLMVIGVPQQITGEGSVQLAMKIRQRAWSKLLDIPVCSMVNHDAYTFGGGLPSTPITGGGKVFLLFQNALDNVPLEGPGVGGSVIRGRITPAYSAFGSPGMYKRFSMVRPTIRAAIVPEVKLTVLTDFAGGTYFNIPSLPNVESALWDVDRWDVGKWAGYLAPIRKWLGVTGAGYAATVQMDMVGVGGTTVMSIDWWLVPGGPL